MTTEYDNAAGQPTTASIPWDGYLDRATGRSLSESTQFSNSTSSTYPSEVLATPPMHRSAEPFFAVNDEDLYPASTAMASSPAFVGSAQMHLGADAPPHFSSYPSIGNEKPHASGTGGNPPVQRAARLVHEQQGDSGSDAITGAHAGIYNAEHPAEAKYRKSYLTRAQAAKSQELDTKVLLADRGDNTARLVPTAEGAYVLDVSIGGRKLIINPERPSEIQYHDPQGLVVTQSLFSHEIPAQ